VAEGNEEPAEQPTLSEDVAPEPQLALFQAQNEAQLQNNVHKTRKWLAIGLFWLVGLMTMLPITALVFGHWTHFTVGQFKELGLFFTPIVTLASAAFGFFFATDDRERRR
jgi:hypothetical protein